MKKITIINGIKGLGRSLSFKFIEDKWKTVVTYSHHDKYVKDIRRLSKIINNKASVIKLDMKRKVYWTRFISKAEKSKAILIIFNQEDTKEIKRSLYEIYYVLNGINLIKNNLGKIKIIFIIERRDNEKINNKVIIKSLMEISKEYKIDVIEYNKNKDKIKTIERIINRIN